MKNLIKNFVLCAFVTAPFALSGCARECVDFADCADKARAENKDYTCEEGVCKPGSPFPDAGSAGGGAGGGSGGGTAGGGTGGGMSGGGTGGGDTGGGTGGGDMGGGAGGGTGGGGDDDAGMGGGAGGGGGDDDAGTGGGGGATGGGAGGGGGATGGGTGGGGDDDGGVDAGVDAGLDAGIDDDAGVDAGLDAGIDDDAGVDAGLDVDAGVDAGTDAGVQFAVLRVGAVGGGALSSTAAEVHLERRDLATGAVVLDIPFPVAAAGGNFPLTLAGSSTSEGVLTISTNNQYAVAVGYNAAPGQASVNSNFGIQRVVGRVDLGNGTINTGTLVNDFAGASIRAAASVDGTGYWLAGTSGSGALDAGVRYVVQGSTGVTADVYSAIQNTRATNVTNGQLYASAASGPVPDGGVTLSRVFAVGTGLPQTSTSTVTYLPGVNIVNPSNFVLLDQSSIINGYDTLYVGDTSAGVGARKYTFDGTVWTQVATFPTTGAAFYVAARVNSPTSATVLVTSAAGVSKWDDTGVTGTAPAGTVISTTPTNTVFRGVAFLP